MFLSTKTREVGSAGLGTVPVDGRTRILLIVTIKLLSWELFLIHVE